MGNKRSVTPLGRRVRRWIKRRCYPGATLGFGKTQCCVSLYVDILDEDQFAIVEREFERATKQGDIEQIPGSSCLYRAVKR